MPLYEYECESCGRRVERIQKFSDPPVTECPSCGKGPVRKLFSSPAIQFKGSGFYITDYAKPGKSTEAESSAKGASDTGGSEKSPSDTGKSDTGKSDKSETSSAPAKTESSSETKPADTKKTSS